MNEPTMGKSNVYGYVEGNPISRKDPSGLTTYVITTFDTFLGASYGSHSALFISTPGQTPFLYDPAGSFSPDGPGTRGSGGYFEGPLLPDYVLYQTSLGSTVQIVPLDTTVAQEAEIIKNAIEIEDPRGFNCANAVSTAIGGACGIKHTNLPGTLYSEAKGSSCANK